MQIEFKFSLDRARVSEPSTVVVDEATLLVKLVRHPRARRYVLRVISESEVQVTVPRGGGRAAALEFAQRQVAWIRRQLARRRAEPRPPTQWRLGSQILFRGDLAVVSALAAPVGPGIQFADQQIPLAVTDGDLRAPLVLHLRRVAVRELPQRVREWAVRLQLTVGSVSVRNQRSRWGSCSRRGRICLNWRLIQMPEFVRDYVILHELAHLREMNHSRRFWKTVAEFCPGWEAARAWLKTHRELLG